MEVVAPRVRVVRRRCAPKTFPCPHCGRRGRRKGTHTRCVRDIAFGEIVVIELTLGEYRARFGCCKTFRSQIDGIEPRAEYTNRVRDAVIDRLLDDGMSLHRLQQALHRDFLLDLSDGFLYDCLDWKVRQTNLPAYRQWTLEQFSGTLCVDELHLGHRTLLLATDPLGDFPVAFAVVAANDQDPMRRFLANLRDRGFTPHVVVTDGSNLYPAVLVDLWPTARHQLCIFHVLKDINACVFDALRRLRRKLAASGGRKRRRGRPNKNQRRAHARRGPTRKQQAYFVWKHRHLIVTRPDHLNGRERGRLSRMFDALPELRGLRRFVLKVYRLFGPEQSPHQARCRRAALVKDPAFQADPDLARALAMLGPEKFEDDRLPPQSDGSTSADQQPRRTHQPPPAFLREGALQMAAANHRSLPGPRHRSLAPTPSHPRPTIKTITAMPFAQSVGHLKVSRLARSVKYSALNCAGP